MSTGTETRFTNGLDPDARTRAVFAVHRPETLADWAATHFDDPHAPTFRHRLRVCRSSTRRTCGRRRSRRSATWRSRWPTSRPRALIQMATGSGKTFTAANVAYRLIKFADAKRILFLVDRANLGRQTLKEFQRSTARTTAASSPSSTTSSTSTSNTIDPVARVASRRSSASTRSLQRRAELDPELDEESAYEAATRRAGAGRLQPGGPARDVRRRHRRRVPPLDLRPLAAGARLLRRLHDRPHRHADQADVRLLQPEPRDGVRPRAGRRRRGQRRLRRLPHPHRDHRAAARRSTPGTRHRASATGRPAHVRWEKLDDDLDLRRRGSSTAPSSPRTRSAR